MENKIGVVKSFFRNAHYFFKQNMSEALQETMGATKSDVRKLEASKIANKVVNNPDIVLSMPGDSNLDILAVRTDPSLFQYISNQTEELSFVAVSMDGMQLEHVNDEFKTLAVCAAAVLQNPDSMQFVPEEFRDEIEQVMDVQHGNRETETTLEESPLLRKALSSIYKRNNMDKDEEKIYSFDGHKNETSSLTERAPVDLDKNFEMAFEMLLWRQALASMYKRDEFLHDSDKDEEKIYAFDGHEIETSSFTKQTPADLDKDFEPGTHKDEIPPLIKQALNDRGKANVYANWENLKYIEDQTPEICMIAVKQDWHALQFVKDQTPEICMAAVQENGLALKYVKDQTYSLCMAAVQKNGASLEFAVNQTPKMCMMAVLQDGAFLAHVNKENMSPELCMAAVKNNRQAIKFVPDNLQQEIFFAIKNGRDTIHLDKDMESKTLISVLKHNQERQNLPIRLDIGANQIVVGNTRPNELSVVVNGHEMNAYSFVEHFLKDDSQTRQFVHAYNEELDKLIKQKNIEERIGAGFQKSKSFEELVGRVRANDSNNQKDTKTNNPEKKISNPGAHGRGHGD